MLDPLCSPFSIAVAVPLPFLVLAATVGDRLLPKVLGGLGLLASIGGLLFWYVGGMTWDDFDLPFPWWWSWGRLIFIAYAGFALVTLRARSTRSARGPDSPSLD